MPKEPIIFAKGFKFPEGPSFDASGNLYLVNLQGHQVSRVTPAGVVSVFAEWEGNPNGSCFDHEGRLLVCDSGKHKSVVRLDAKGKPEILTDRPAEGKTYHGPNDICIDQKSRIYFTDPGDFSKPTGAIYRLDPEGKVALLDEPLQYCNGIAVDAQQKYLYVALTPLKRIVRYALKPDGGVGPRQQWAKLEDGGAGPDGMRFDRAGNLYYAHFGLGKIVKLDHEGKKVAEHDAGGKNPTNVAFGPLPHANDPTQRDQWKCLYITEAEKGLVTYHVLDTAGMSLG